MTQEFNQHSELLSQKVFSSLQIQCHPSLFKYGNCQSFQGKIYTHHVLIHRGLQSLGYAELLKVMVSFARYSQTSIFYSPWHPNYWNVVKVYYIFACQLICKNHTYLLTQKNTPDSLQAKMAPSSSQERITHLT